MNPLYNISESEKGRILLMHKSYVPKRYANESQSLTIDELLKEFKDELEFQRELHLFRLSMLEENEKISYLTKIQDKFVSGLFKNSLIIQENYQKIFKPLISESANNFSDQIKKFNNFLIDSLIHDFNKIIPEQWTNMYYDSKTGDIKYQTPPTPAEIGASVKSALQSAVDYIKKNGVEFVFEGLRKALLSGVGTAIQVALSFTGVGAIANEIAWGIMTLYDLYQLASSKAGALANVIIDLICLLTAGNLGKVLSKWVGFGSTSIKSVLQSFMSGGLGKYLTPIIGLIEKGAGKISQFLMAGAKLAEQKMGIKWLTNLVNSGSKFFKNLATEFKSVMSHGATVIGSGLVRVGVKLPAKFEAKIFAELSKKSEEELTKIAGEQIEKSVLKAVEKEANERLIEKPTETALNYIDKKFGTKFGNLYAAYLGGKKLASTQSKLSSGYEVSDIGSEALRKKDPLSKSEKQVEKIKQATAELG